jgi:hypothetical protein
MNENLPALDIERSAFKITKPGPLTVKDVVLIHKTERMAALQIDFKEKYLKVEGSGANDDVPTISVCTAENGVEGEDWVEVELSDFPGWSIWSASRGKYSVQIALILK